MSFIRAEAANARPRFSEENSPTRNISLYKPQYVILANSRKKYIPSLYQNPDKELARRIKTFLRKPPLNSQEYFDSMWRRSQSEPSLGGTRERDDGDMFSRVQSSPDERNKKFLHLLPERRTIQSALLPPISAGCTRNFNCRYVSPDPQPMLGDENVDDMEWLQFCQYLRPTPERKIDREWGSGYLDCSH